MRKFITTILAASLALAGTNAFAQNLVAEVGFGLSDTRFDYTFPEGWGSDVLAVRFFLRDTLVGAGYTPYEYIAFASVMYRDCFFLFQKIITSPFRNIKYLY